MNQTRKPTEKLTHRKSAEKKACLLVEFGSFMNYENLAIDSISYFALPDKSFLVWILQPNLNHCLLIFFHLPLPIIVSLRSL